MQYLVYHSNRVYQVKYHDLQYQMLFEKSKNIPTAHFPLSKAFTRFSTRITKAINVVVITKSKLKFVKYLVLIKEVH